MMGHDHNRGTLAKQSLKVKVDQHTGQPSVKSKTQLCCRTGSFLKGYAINEANYVTRALWSPSSIGHVEILGKVSRSTKCAGMKQMTRLKLQGIA